MLRIFNKFGEEIGIIGPYVPDSGFGFGIKLTLLFLTVGGSILVWPAMFVNPVIILLGIPSWIAIAICAYRNAWEVQDGFVWFWFKLTGWGCVAGAGLGVLLVLVGNILFILVGALIGLWFSALPAFVLTVILRIVYR